MLRYELKMEYLAACEFFGLNAEDNLNLMIFKFLQELKADQGTRILPTGKSYVNGNKVSN